MLVFVSTVDEAQLKAAKDSFAARINTAVKAPLMIAAPYLR